MVLSARLDLMEERMERGPEISPKHCASGCKIDISLGGLANKFTIGVGDNAVYLG